MTKQSFAHTCQVSYAYALDGDTDLDRKPIGWPVRSVYGLCSESEDEAAVYDRDNIWLPRVKFSLRRFMSS